MSISRTRPTGKSGEAVGPYTLDRKHRKQSRESRAPQIVKSVSRRQLSFHRRKRGAGEGRQGKRRMVRLDGVKRERELRLYHGLVFHESSEGLEGLPEDLGGHTRVELDRKDLPRSPKGGIDAYIPSRNNPRR